MTAIFGRNYGTENTRNFPIDPKKVKLVIQGYPEIAQKATEGANVTCRNMNVILR